MKAGIIIGFRDTNGERTRELAELHDRIEHICTVNNQDYHIYVIVQDDDQLFNKASLMNIGVKLSDCDYFIFHDVDNIPIGEDNVYRYREYTGNICGKINGIQYTDIDDHFGDVVLFKKEDFFAVNGWCNYFWGWGWELTAMPVKLQRKGIIYRRGDGEFKTMVHDTSHRFGGNPNHTNNVIIYRMAEDILDPSWDGYSTVSFEISNREDEKDMSMIYVKLPPPQYDTTRTLTKEDIIRISGQFDEKTYQWILETYK
jgi:hypothetical protein